MQSVEVELLVTTVVGGDGAEGDAAGGSGTAAGTAAGVAADVAVASGDDEAAAGTAGTAETAAAEPGTSCSWPCDAGSVQDGNSSGQLLACSSGSPRCEVSWAGMASLGGELQV